jgi:hypothetical protein
LFFLHHLKEFQISSKAPAFPSKFHIPKAKFNHTSQRKGSSSPEREGQQLLGTAQISITAATIVRKSKPAFQFVNINFTDPL